MGNFEDGKILDSKIEKNIDGEVPTQLFQTALAEEGDTETIEELHIPCFQYRPEDNARGFVGWITNQWRAFFSINDQVTKKVLNQGECIVYSYLGGIIQAEIHVKNDKTIIITTLGGAGDVVVDGISVKNHLHPGEMGGTVGPPTMASVSTPNPATPGFGLDVGSNEVTASGKALSFHTHPINSGSSAPGPTGAPT